jgi:arylsulfatase A-like enzyme
MTHRVRLDALPFIAPLSLCSNGPHTLPDAGSLDPESSARPGGQLCATNGLRQCKASVFEGGIRVPGFIVWPQLIGPGHMGRTSYVASSLDFMATVNEILGLEYPRKGWRVDSKSLLPLLDGRVALAAAARQKPIGWQYGEQRALTNQSASGSTWKLVERGALGQCAVMLPPYKSRRGTYLFNLDADETESHDLCASDPAQCDAMKALMEGYMAGVAGSAANESMCSGGEPPYGPPPSPPHVE